MCCCYCFVCAPARWFEPKGAGRTANVGVFLQGMAAASGSGHDTGERRGRSESEARRDAMEAFKLLLIVSSGLACGGERASRAALALRERCGRLRLLSVLFCCANTVAQAVGASAVAGVAFHHAMEHTLNTRPQVHAHAVAGEPHDLGWLLTGLHVCVCRVLSVAHPEAARPRAV